MGERERETRGECTVAADSSSVHYRRSGLHVRRETRLKTGFSIGSENRMRPPSDPGTHTAPSPFSSCLLSFSSSSLLFLLHLFHVQSTGSFTPPLGAGWKHSDFRKARMWAGPDSRLPTPYFRR